MPCLCHSAKLGVFEGTSVAPFGGAAAGLSTELPRVRCGLGAVCSKRTRNSNGPARTTAARARGGSTGGSYGEASGEDLLGEFVESDGVGDISSLVGCRPIPGRYLKPRSWDVSGMACQQLIADPQELLIDRNCAGSGGLGPFPA